MLHFENPNVGQLGKLVQNTFKPELYWLFSFSFLKKNKFLNAFSYENTVSVAMDCMCNKQLFVVIKHPRLALQFN